jgi:hypothetical protein
MRSATFLRPLKLAAGVVILASLASVVVFSRVTVRNDATVTSTGVSLSGHGFTQTVAELEPGGTHTFWFVPRAETDAHLAFHAAARKIDAGSHGYFQAPPHLAVAFTLVVDPRFNASRR